MAARLTCNEQSAFDDAILQRVDQTFQLSGLNITLTDNPNVSAAHTLSVVSNTSSQTLPSAIGMTDIGSNGFSFIDQIAPTAKSLDQLEWIVAHNVSHELMLAFGVGENYDKSGNYIDAEMANNAMLIDPNAHFSPAAAQALQAAGLSGVVQGAALMGTGNADVTAAPIALSTVEPVPEPTTLAFWSLVLVGLVVARRR